MKKISNNDILKRLDSIIQNPQSELEYSSTFELLVAVMLSAQCTDKRVNLITRELFKIARTPEAFAVMNVDDLIGYIKSCNYYKNKANNIIAMSKILVEEFGGQVPCVYDELIRLPGVGNKTANVVLAVAFNQQALAVDTHILRVSNRLGFVDTHNPTKCEGILKEKFKGFDYVHLHHLLLLFGRYYCTARSPKCENCIMKDICKKKD